jgi:hypothetical protein
MTNYLVELTITIDADSAEEAAAEFRTYLNSISAVSVTVEDEDGHCVEVIA